MNNSPTAQQLLEALGINDLVGARALIDAAVKEDGYLSGFYAMGLLDVMDTEGAFEAVSKMIDAAPTAPNATSIR